MMCCKDRFPPPSKGSYWSRCDFYLSIGTFIPFPFFVLSGLENSSPSRSLISFRFLFFGGDGDAYFPLPGAARSSR